ncbi:DUF1566 domain-containing protein [Crocinitomicaceae bacterium]|nr:DUF1566 domain-containing protein [Crocinitomicaceae bacterium]
MWHENGQLWTEGNYKDGKEEGVQKDWYENGQIWDELNYKDGKEEGVQKSWYENGQLRSESNYKDGKEEGVQKSWHENGVLAYTEYYKDGKKEGVQKSWYWDGQLMSEWNYKDGKEEGVQKSWYENGQLRSEFNYKDGKRIHQYPLSTIKIGNLEVMTENLGEMDWDAAMSACADLGGGWRLPTKEELNVLYENKDEIGGFANDYYWSSTEDESYTAWIQGFGDGDTSYGLKDYINYYVRAVRAF